MSVTRKEFDVKQILRIRCRFFGHSASPPTSNDNRRGEFWNKDQGASNNGRKFLDSGHLQQPLASINYQRSSQQNIQNSPSWHVPPAPDLPSFEFTTDDHESIEWHGKHEAKDEESEEDNETDSSSCRLGFLV